MSNLAERDTKAIYPDCGTYAGWNKHQRRGTPSCTACKAAATTYTREYRASNPRARSNDRRYSKARNRALTRLAHAHRFEYHELLMEELAALSTPETPAP